MVCAFGQKKSQLTKEQRLGSVFDDLDPRLSLLCQAGDDVIRPCKICGGCQIHVPKSIRSLPHTISTQICIRSALILSTSKAIKETNQ